MKHLITFPIFLLLIQLAIGQPCSNFHKDIGCAVRGTEGFKLFGQSKSAMVEAGKTYQYQVVLFGGYDYKLGLCAESGFTPIHFRIINAADSSVFYDNLDDEYLETVGFSNEKTKNVIFEITLMATESVFKDVGDSRACIGVAIYWQRTPKLGI